MIDEVEILFILTYEKKISSILEIQFIYKFINLISRSNASLKFSTHTLYSTHQIIKKKKINLSSSNRSSSNYNNNNNSNKKLSFVVIVVIIISSSSISTSTTTLTNHS